MNSGKSFGLKVPTNARDVDAAGVSDGGEAAGVSDGGEAAQAVAEDDAVGLQKSLGPLAGSMAVKPMTRSSLRYVGPPVSSRENACTNGVRNTQVMRSVDHGARLAETGYRSRPLKEQRNQAVAL